MGVPRGITGCLLIAPLSARLLAGVLAYFGFRGVFAFLMCPRRGSASAWRFKYCYDCRAAVSRIIGCVGVESGHRDLGIRIEKFREIISVSASE